MSGQIVLQDLMVKLALDMKDFSVNLDKATGKISGFEKSSKEMAGKMGEHWKGLGSIIAGAVAVYAVKALGDFESAVISTAAVLSKTKGDFEDIKNSIAGLSKELSENTIYSVTDTANALNNLAIEGFSSVGKAAKDLNPILDFATATNMSLADATNVTIDTLKLFGYGLEDVGRIGASVVGAIGASQAQVQNFANALRMAGGDIKSSGASIEDLATVVGHFDDAGIQARLATTALKEVLQTLQNPTEAFTKALESAGISTSSLHLKQDGLVKTLANLARQGFTSDMALKAFGETAAGAVSTIFALGENGKLVAENMESMTKSLVGGTAATDISAEKLKGFNNQIVIIINNLKQIGISIGENLLPHIKKLTDGIITAQKSTQEWAKENPYLAESFGKIATAAGTMAVVVLGVTKSIEAFQKVAIAMGLSNPVAALAATIAIESAVVITAYKGMSDAQKEFEATSDEAFIGASDRYTRLNATLLNCYERTSDLTDAEKEQMEALKNKAEIIYGVIAAESKKDKADQENIDRYQQNLLTLEAEGKLLADSVTQRLALVKLIETSVKVTDQHTESMKKNSEIQIDSGSALTGYTQKLDTLFFAFRSGAVTQEDFSKGVTQIAADMNAFGMTAEAIGEKIRTAFDKSGVQAFGDEMKAQKDVLLELDKQILDDNLSGKEKIIADAKIKWIEEQTLIESKKTKTSEAYVKEVADAKKAYDDEVKLIQSKTEKDSKAQDDALKAAKKVLGERLALTTTNFNKTIAMIEEEKAKKALLVAQDLERAGIEQNMIKEITNGHKNLIETYIRASDATQKEKESMREAIKEITKAWIEATEAAKAALAMAKQVAAMGSSVSTGVGGGGTGGGGGGGGEEGEEEDWEDKEENEGTDEDEAAENEHNSKNDDGDEYANGGFTGSGNNKEIAGVVHKNEYVLPADSVQAIGVNALDALRDGDNSLIKELINAGSTIQSSGFGGGIIGPRISSERQGMQSIPNDEDESSEGSYGYREKSSSQNITIINQIDPSFISAAMKEDSVSGAIINVIGQDVMKNGTTAKVIRKIGGLR